MAGKEIHWTERHMFRSREDREEEYRKRDEIEDPVKKARVQAEADRIASRDRLWFKGRFEDLRMAHHRGVLFEGESEELVAMYEITRGLDTPPDLLGTSRKVDGKREAEAMAVKRMERELAYWKRIRAEEGWMPAGGELFDRLAESKSGRLRIKPQQMTDDVMKQILVMCHEGTVNLILEDQETDQEKRGTGVRKYKRGE